jgi:hypothetical protein
MERCLLKLIAVFTAIILLAQTAYAAGDPNIDGGGGSMGQGTTNNGWAVSSSGGGLIYDAEGLRLYLVNASTGVPVSVSIDITNFNVATNNMRNFQGATKHDYAFVDGTLDLTDTYNYVRVASPATPLPQIIPWEEGNNAARIGALKDWFLDDSNAGWLFEILGVTEAEMKSGSYIIAMEPIAYFRYQGVDYAMTATEAALFDQVVGGDLRSKLGPLTHKNLPLALFLEDSEFTGDNEIGAWNGSRSNTASNSDIISQLGFGTIRYFAASPHIYDGTDTRSYPTNTWVLTSITLCNVTPTADYTWLAGERIALDNPASVTFNILGTNYVVGNIYIPSGGEQLVYVKWRTPSTPQVFNIEVTTDSGYIFNPNTDNESNRYVGAMTLITTIANGDGEDTPPDPRPKDTPGMYNYNHNATGAARTGRMNQNLTSATSWTVWGCVYEYVGDDDEEEDEYVYRFFPIVFTVELRLSNTGNRIMPSEHVPTAFKNPLNANEWIMKSGYGINIQVANHIYTRVENTRTGEVEIGTYTSATACPFATNSQTATARFPEFAYSNYFRRLDNVGNGIFRFRSNIHSTYNDRSHFTPLWYPDDMNYTVIVTSGRAYTPTGILQRNSESNVIRIEGNVYDDWYVAPVKV